MYKDGKYIGYIYKITNIINKKIYIGQTRQTISRRWSQHITNSKLKQTHSILDEAIKKYGADNFIIECVQQFSADSKRELINLLNQSEKEYIEMFKSLTKYGNYNITSGGEKTSDLCFVSIDQYDLDGNFIKTYSSIIDATYELNINENCYTNISACCNGKKVTAYGYVWRYKGDPFNKYRTNKNTTSIHFPIDVYDMDGNLLYQYDDCQDAIKDNIVNRIQDIQKVCQGINSGYHKMVFRYKGDAYDKYPINHKNKNNKYNGYDLNTQKICIENMSTKDIWKYLNTDNNIPFKSVTNHISDCVHKRCNSWHGFKWYYANDPNQPDKTKIVI